MSQKQNATRQRPEESRIKQVKASEKGFVFDFAILIINGWNVLGLVEGSWIPDEQIKVATKEKECCRH